MKILFMYVIYFLGWEIPSEKRTTLIVVGTYLIFIWFAIRFINIEIFRSKRYTETNVDTPSEKRWFTRIFTEKFINTWLIYLHLSHYVPNSIPSLRNLYQSKQLNRRFWGRKELSRLYHLFFDISNFFKFITR